MAQVGAGGRLATVAGGWLAGLAGWRRVVAGRGWVAAAGDGGRVAVAEWWLAGWWRLAVAVAGWWLRLAVLTAGGWPVVVVAGWWRLGGDGWLGGGQAAGWVGWAGGVVSALGHIQPRCGNSVSVHFRAMITR
ncbi:hypothetical protein ACFYOT_28305 [Saccharothrix saharensis]|uniref:hypothetical protein n=1 Tax=Saccharothrix saharensis TaxID=571190 RepID=UPI0036885B12